MTKSTEPQTHSETTGQPKQELKPQNSTGLQHGATGSGEIQIAKGTIGGKELQLMKTSLRDLLDQPLKTRTQLEQVETLTQSLSKLPPPSWVQGRVLTTLTMYFVGAVPTAVSEMISDDYVRELEQYPAWAIMAACRWWISQNNKDRRRKPLPGDLSERASLEITILRLAKQKLRDGIQEDKPQEPEPEIDYEQRRKNTERLLKSFRQQRKIEHETLQSDEEFRKQQARVLKETREALSREARVENFSEPNTSDQEQMADGES